MEDFIQIALPAAFTLAGLALVWLLVELALMVRKGRTAVDDVMKDVQPIIKDAGEITESLKPTVAKLDPMMDRLNLTLDAANLEIMRVDAILEDVADITDTMSNASTAVNNIAAAPAAAVATVSDRVRGALKGSKAGRTSADLAQAKREAAAESSDEKEADAQ